AASANERQVREAAQLLKAQQLGNTFETSVTQDDGDDGDGGEGGSEGSADCSSSPSPTPSTASSVSAVPVTKSPHSNSAMFARMTALKPSGSSRGTSADGPHGAVAPAVDRVN